MADHVVGHFSSTVGPRVPSFEIGPIAPADRAELVRLLRESRFGEPIILSSLLGIAARPEPDPADWRFREDGY